MVVAAAALVAAVVFVAVVVSGRATVECDKWASDRKKTVPWEGCGADTPCGLVCVRFE